MSWSCVPRGLTPSFCEGGKLSWQFCDFRLVAVGSEIGIWIMTTWTKPTRDRLWNCHQQSPWSLQICGTNFSYVGSMSKISPNLQQKPDLHCFDFQSSVSGKLSPVGCHLLRSYPNNCRGASNSNSEELTSPHYAFFLLKFLCFLTLGQTANISKGHRSDRRWLKATHRPLPCCLLCSCGNLQGAECSQPLTC